MLRAHARPVWHLMRGQKMYSRISDRELLLLAELGHLRPGDLVWRPGLGGWRSAQSVSGTLTPPPLPPAQSQPDAKRITSLLSTARKHVIRWQDKLTLIAKDHAGSIKVHLWRIYPLRTKLDLGDVFRRVQDRGTLVGMMIVLVFVGSIDVAMRTSFAIGAQTPTENTASPKLQHRQIAAVGSDTTRPVQTSNPSELQPAEPSASQSVSAAPLDSISNLSSASQSVSAAPPDLVPPTVSVSVPPSESGVQPDSIPLPTRKPARLTAKPLPSTAVLRRIARRQRDPESMRFGSFGYNYTDPAQ